MAYRNDTPLPVVLTPPADFNSCLASASCCLTEAQMWVIITYLLAGRINEGHTLITASEALALIGVSGPPYTNHYLMQLLTCTIASALDDSRTLDDLWKAAQSAGFNSISDYQRWLIIITGLQDLLLNA